MVCAPTRLHSLGSTEPSFFHLLGQPLWLLCQLPPGSSESSPVQELHIAVAMPKAHDDIALGKGPHDFRAGSLAASSRTGPHVHLPLSMHARAWSSASIFASRPAISAPMISQFLASRATPLQATECKKRAWRELAQRDSFPRQAVSVDVAACKEPWATIEQLVSLAAFSLKDNSLGSCDS